MSTPITLVALDAWRTMVDYGPAMTAAKTHVREPLLQALRAHGVHTGDAASFEKVYRRIKDSTEHLSEITGRHIGPLERYMMVAMAFGLPGELACAQIQDAAREGTRRMEEVLPELIDPDLPHSLKALQQRGIVTAVVSNLGVITADYMRRSFRELGIYDCLDLQFYSDETGLCKPNPALLEQVCRVAGCDADAVLFIGDNANADYHGPRDFGMQAALIGPPTEGVAVAAPTVTAALREFNLI